MTATEETLEIADLEYDVGGVHAIEAGDVQNVNESVIIHYLPPM